jgi:hypothetical protein
VVVSNWEDVRKAEEWCDALLATLGVDDNDDKDEEGEGLCVSVGLDCEWCAPWWQKGGMGDAIQTIQLYAPPLGALVYSTGHKVLHICLMCVKCHRVWCVFEVWYVLGRMFLLL